MAGFRFDPYTGQPIYDDPFTQRMRMMQGNQMGQNPGYTPPQTQSTGLNRVTGFEGAKAFFVPPNSVAPLFDDTRDVFYIKSTDSGGFASYKAFQFSPLEDAAQTEQTPAIKKEEILEMIREEVERYGKQFVWNQKQQYKPDVTAEAVER